VVLKLKLKPTCSPQGRQDELAKVAGVEGLVRSTIAQ
jgi:hypothetical protein